LIRSASLRRALVYATFTACLAPAVADATTLHFDGTAASSPMTLNGDAYATSTGSVRIVSNVNNQIGSAFFDAPVRVAATTSFHASFSFQIGPNPAGADGIAFVLQASADGASAIGQVGGALGYTGIAPSAAIEFDTYWNSWDPNSNHVALLLGGDPTTHVTYATPPFPIAGGATRWAWVDYDGDTKRVDVYLSQASAKPDAATLTSALDLPANVGPGSVFIGFTSATGNARNDHDLLTFDLTIDDVGCASDADCGGATPVCLASGACGCSGNASCGAGDICDGAASEGGACVPGCQVLSGVDSCASGGGACSATDGSVGTCLWPSSASSGGSVSSSATSGSGASVGAGGSGGAGGADVEGAGGSAASGAAGAGGGAEAGAGGSGGGDAEAFDEGAYSDPDQSGACACREAPGIVSSPPGMLALAACLALAFARRKASTDRNT
jgi:hypothetical protein